MDVNFALKAELIRRFGSQVVAAQHMGIREAKLSYIIRGHALATERERRVLEESLGKAVVRKLLKTHDHKS